MRARWMVVALFLFAASASAQEPAPVVSDAVLAAAKDHVVVLTLATGGVVSATPVSFDDHEVVVLEEDTRRFVAIPRADIVQVQLAEPAPAPPAPAISTSPPTKTRHLGVQVASGIGNPMLDLEIGHFYGFASTSIAYPLLNEPGSLFSFAVGLGVTWKLRHDSNWSFDVTGTITPTWWNGFSAGLGVTAGIHYTAKNGFTLGFKVPVIGGAPGSGFKVDSGNYSGSYQGARIISTYFLQAAMVQPLFSIGYRF